VVSNATGYTWIIALILELAGLHPRLDCDPEWAEMLRRAGWRPFLMFRIKG
jgi:hypothetical protein